MSHDPVKNEIAYNFCGLLPVVLVSNTYCFELAVFAKFYRSTLTVAQ